MSSFFPVSLNETKKIVDFQLYETTIGRKVFFFSELFFGPLNFLVYDRNLIWTHEILWPVLCKKWGFRRNLIYFLFLLWHSFMWNCTKLSEWFSDFFASKKWNWLMVSCMKLAKIMKPPISVRKKNETDGTRLRRGRQFHFFSWPKLDGFIILASFIHETTTSFIFGGKKTENIQTVSCSFTWNWPQKKKKNEVST